MSKNMCGLLESLPRKTLLSRSCSLRSTSRSCSLRSPGRSGRGRAARATATLSEPVRVENSEEYPRGL